MKRGCLIPLIVLLAVLVCLVAAVGGYLLLATPPSTPLVLINSPRNSEQIGVGQATFIHAVARGEQKIKRVELWIDGQLQDAQSSNVPGGVTPFPLVFNWRPLAPGAHAVTVRAYDTQNARGTASINVEAVQSGDRDNDGVTDALDGCPDQPGLPTNNGCPLPTTDDRDGDGILDNADACPDQPGSTLAEGCPDADDDGVPDNTDACPREFGAPERNGCPAPGDADGDGVADATDACPDEPGSAPSDCPDSDGDGVRNLDDVCPDEPGTPGTGGCPDRDGDGVRDAFDLCPDVVGPASNSGCPPTGSGDSDGDGVDDSTDLSRDEPGSDDSGGAPPPGGGADGDGDGIPDAEEPREDPLGGLDLFMPGYLLEFTPVELQALEFQVAQDYSQVYCYASVANQAAERVGPFASLGARRWDIAAFLGPLNSRTFLAPTGQPLQVRLECSGIVGGSEAYFDLGSFSRNHTISSTMIDELTMDSSGGTAGHTFRVKYRVCVPGCKTPVLRAPTITLLHGGGQHRLAWAWAGHSYDIDGFKVYMNGNYMFQRDPRSTNYLFRDAPPCGRSFDIQLTAYRGNPYHPDQESPRSNTVTWDGGLCPRTVLVSFERFDTGDLRGMGPASEPIYGSFCAGDECRDFDSDYRVNRNTQHRISDFFPRNDFTVDLGLDDSLYLGATIRDRDRDPVRNNDNALFNAESILLPAEITTREYTITEYGGNQIVIRLTVTPRP